MTYPSIHPDADSPASEDGQGRAASPPRGSLRIRKRTPPGAAPGTLIADESAARLQIRVIAYDAERLEEREVGSARELSDLMRPHTVTWVDVQGLGDVGEVRELGEIFGLHGLALEDVVNVHQRPKVEQYEDHLFIVTRMPTGGAGTEQLTLFLGESYVLTFQERPGDCFDPVRERLRRSPGGRIRSSRPDYLAYALLDAAIDGFFPVLEHYGEAVESLEMDVVAAPEAALVPRLHALKRDLLALRRAIWPQRELLSALIRDETPLVSEQTRLYLRDCYDHTIQLLDMVETYREIASGLIDVYLSSVSARLNEIMKVLTIMATIFIPLGFIASLYGMNFDTERSPWNMPELGWSLGYPFALALMAAVAAGLLYYFRRRGWIGGAREAG